MNVILNNPISFLFYFKTINERQPAATAVAIMKWKFKRCNWNVSDHNFLFLLNMKNDFMYHFHMVLSLCFVLEKSFRWALVPVSEQQQQHHSQFHFSFFFRFILRWLTLADEIVVKSESKNGTEEKGRTEIDREWSWALCVYDWMTNGFSSINDLMCQNVCTIWGPFFRCPNRSRNSPTGLF